MERPRRGGPLRRSRSPPEGRFHFGGMKNREGPGEVYRQTRHRRATQRGHPQFSLAGSPADGNCAISTDLSHLATIPGGFPAGLISEMMGHARPHPSPRSRCQPRNLADLLRRRPCRHDRAPLRQSNHLPWLDSVNEITRTIASTTRCFSGRAALG